MTDLEIFTAMLQRAGIAFKVTDNKRGGKDVAIEQDGYPEAEFDSDGKLMSIWARY